MYDVFGMRCLSRCAKVHGVHNIDPVSTITHHGKGEALTHIIILHATLQLRFEARQCHNPGLVVGSRIGVVFPEAGIVHDYVSAEAVCLHCMRREEYGK